MTQELSYRAGAAAGYDRAFGSISGQFIPALLCAARVGLGCKVLDVATGTGVAAEAAIAVEDGQSLTFPDEQFDAVLCAMGLMLFPDPARGLSEFCRVLREGRWAAVSVNTVPERAFTTRVNAVIGQHSPEHAEIGARYFSLGNAGLLRSLFTAAGFRDIETFTETRRYPFPSFGAYFKPIEEGQGEPGQAFVALPTAIQRLAREDVRRQLEGNAVTGGPVEVEVELLFGCGRR